MCLNTLRPLPGAEPSLAGSSGGFSGPTSQFPLGPSPHPRTPPGWANFQGVAGYLGLSYCCYKDQE